MKKRKVKPSGMNQGQMVVSDSQGMFPVKGHLLTEHELDILIALSGGTWMVVY